MKKKALLIFAVLTFSSIYPAAGQTGPGSAWAWQGGKVSHNGSVQLKSANGTATYNAVQNPTGTMVKSNQSALTQPPLVVVQAITGSKVPCFFGIRYNRSDSACPLGAPVQRDLYDTEPVAIITGSKYLQEPIIMEVRAPQLTYERSGVARYGNLIAHGTAYSTGKTATEKILAEETGKNTAAYFCSRNTNLNGLGYVPSLAEMQQIYNIPEVRSQFPAGVYWTSTELNSTRASTFNMATGEVGSSAKHLVLPYLCRAHMTVVYSW